MTNTESNQEPILGNEPLAETTVETAAAPSVEVHTDTLPSVEEQFRTLELKAAEHYDAWLRAKAEGENIRRRAQEDISKAHKFAVEKFAGELLAVKDSLEAAIASHAAKPDTPIETVLEGVHATLRQLTSALDRNKVIEINPPAGTKFDPHQHQAISMVPADQEANTVVGVLQKGYLIADRVLRPSLVTVAAPK